MRVDHGVAHTQTVLVPSGGSLEVDVTIVRRADFGLRRPTRPRVKLSMHSPSVWYLNLLIVGVERQLTRGYD